MADAAVAWSPAFARRTQGSGGEITAILSLAGAKDIITFSGGFPAPETFPVEVIGELSARLLAEDAAVALQYSPTEGLASVRDTLAQRLAGHEGRRPAEGELMVTSGGIDALQLVGKSLLDAGDVVVVEDPTYLGAIMAFRGFEADVVGIPMDAEGMDVGVLADRLADGLRPKLLYSIPEHQNPTGLTLSTERRQALVELCRRYGVLVLEDVAYRELGFADERLPSLWSLGPDVVVQAGTFSKTFCPGVRLGWAAGPAAVIGHMVTAKQNTDQCAGALGQRLMEEYVRGGHLDRQLVASRALYERRCELTMAALEAHMPAGVSWTRPRGGFFTWVTTPGAVDTVAMCQQAAEAKVAYVPGTPFHPGEAGLGSLRLAFSRVAEDDIDEGIGRIAGLLTAGRSAPAS
ncbi:MAG TPA: PLP-dependent aminotransferase family protein [Candidatus Limnocylindria bacterium]|nr:PLP-dependent aminotransferase family protein [Candidatus Limnocylindria bacterium]